jgi:hypothetical protein
MNMKTSLLAAALAMLPVAVSAFPIAISGTEGLPVIVTGTDAVIATYQGNSASYSNDLYLGVSAAANPSDVFIFNNHANSVGDTYNLGTFDLGTELIFRLYVNNTGESFYTGPAARNPDDLAHARVQADWEANTPLVSFEDLFGTPEGVNGFNDLSFSFTNTSTTPAVPEPTSLALLGVGLVGIGLGMRRRKA